MKEYHVLIAKIVSHVVSIKANSPEEAQDMVKDGQWGENNTVSEECVEWFENGIIDEYEIKDKDCPNKLEPKGTP